MLVVHPDAPRGSGGSGVFKDARPITPRADDRSVPHPHSPQGRNAWIELDDGESLRNKDDEDGTKKPVIYLDKEVHEKAEVLVDKATVRTKTPKGDPPECFDLVDHIYTAVGAKRPHDVGENVDYVWGEPIDLTDVRSGDVLQIRDHSITVRVDVSTLEVYVNGGGRTEIDDEDPAADLDEMTFIRGHHTAVVSEALSNGLFKVIEQHVTDHSTKRMTTVVRKNDLHTQGSTSTTVVKKTKVHPEHGEGTLTITTKTTITVSGEIFPYRAVKK